MSKRIEQINALLQQELAKVFSEQFEFEPGVLVTVARVETSADLGHAKIFISVLPFETRKTVLNKIRENIKEIQKIIFSRLTMSSAPRLHFLIDEAEENAEFIEELLDEVKKDL